MRWFKANRTDTAAEEHDPGFPAASDGAHAIAAVEALTADVLVLSAADAAAPHAAVEAVWREAERAAHPNAAGRPARTLRTGSAADALAAAVGVAQTGRRAAVCVGSEALLAAQDAMAAWAGQGVPLVVQAALQAVGPPGAGCGAGHEAWHTLAPAGWVQLLASDAQAAADLTVIARSLAEQALLPVLVAQDAWDTTHGLQDLLLPAPGAVGALLGKPEDRTPSATPLQTLCYGATRPRLPAAWAVDDPAASGATLGAESYSEAAFAHAAFVQAHAAPLLAAACDAFAARTGRRYGALRAHACERADTIIVAQGAIVPLARAIAAQLQTTRKLRVGVVEVVSLQPFAEAELATLLLGTRRVLVAERLQPPFGGDGPLLAAVRSALHKAAENGRGAGGNPRHPGFPSPRRLDALPALYGASYGLGGRTPDAGALWRAVAQLQHDPRSRMLSLDTHLQRTEVPTPAQELHDQQLADAYPELAELAPPATDDAEPPALQPAGTLALGFVTRTGQEPFTGTDHPAALLWELAGLHVRAWGPAGARPRGGAALHGLLAGPAPLPCAAPPARWDVLVADAIALRSLPDAAQRLRTGGTLLLLTASSESAPTWAAAPAPLAGLAAERAWNVLALPARALAWEEGGDAEGRRAALRALVQGALLATGPVLALTGLSDRALVRELRSVLLTRAPEAEAAELDDTLERYRRGMEALVPLEPPAESAAPETAPAAATPSGTVEDMAAPQELRGLPAHPVPLRDRHRFRETHTAALRDGAALPDAVSAFAAVDVLPPGTGALRDLSTRRATYPRWLPERCTGCGNCWSLCPDAALPALVHTPAEILETGVRLMEARGQATDQLTRAVRVLDGKLQEALAGSPVPGAVSRHWEAAVTATLPASRATPDEREALAAQLAHLQAAVADIPLAVTAPFYSEREGAARGSGGLLSIILDPGRCKACGACVQSCPEAALELATTNPADEATLRHRWALWQALPETQATFREALPEPTGQPGLRALLLGKRIYRAFGGGADTPPGAAESTALHLLTAVATAALQPRVATHLERIEQCIAELRAHLRQRLAVDVEDAAALRAATSDGDEELTLAGLSSRLDPDRTPIDRAWLERVLGMLQGLEGLRDAYRDGNGGPGRSSMGIVAARDRDTAAFQPYPFSPFLLPYAGQAPAHSAGMALGLFEGHLLRMAEGLRWLRMAELELAGRYNPEVHDPYFARFDWRDFTDAEWALCPPVVLTGGDAALAGAAAGGALALLRSGRPVKVLCLDAAAYRTLAAQPGTLPPFGEDDPAPEHIAAAPAAPTARPDLALLALAQRNAFVYQGSLADVPGLLQGLLDGLGTPGAALINVFRASLPDDGVADALAAEQSTLAHACRAHPALRYDPAAGVTPEACLSLAGNPEPEQAWPTWALTYRNEEGAEETRQAPLTFADFALTVPDLQHHYRPLPADADDATPVAEYLELDADERRETRPYVAAVDAGGRLRRYAVSAALVLACEERRAAWQFLRALTREDVVPVDEAAIAEEARQAVLETVWQNLVELAQGNGDLAAALAAQATAPDAADAADAAATTVAGGEEGPHA